MRRLGILYPPCGAEFEYYQYGERLSGNPRIVLVGVRIHGGDDEHAPEHLSRTGEIHNLVLSARALAPVQPDAAVWACTSGSFVDGLAHARAQVEAISETTGCPATSTSLAFVEALACVGRRRVSVLASYPEQTASRFFRLLSDCGIRTHAFQCLNIDSGPAAAGLPLESAVEACRGLDIPQDAALLVPDTAIPTMHWIEPLERELNRPVLTANQVSLWHTARLAGIPPGRELPGALFRAD